MRRYLIRTNSHDDTKNIRPNSPVKLIQSTTPSNDELVFSSVPSIGVSQKAASIPKSIAMWMQNASCEYDRFQLSFVNCATLMTLMTLIGNLNLSNIGAKDIDDDKWKWLVPLLCQIILQNVYFRINRIEFRFICSTASFNSRCDELKTLCWHYSKSTQNYRSGVDQYCGIYPLNFRCGSSCQVVLEKHPSEIGLMFLYMFMHVSINSINQQNQPPENVSLNLVLPV